MIPKIIHYCWFGGNPLPKTTKDYISTWKKYNPDYEIKEWNENNFNIHCCKYVKEAYNAKKWAFVSDYARFYALYNEGGIYFDTDIEVLKSFDNLLDCGAFFGFGWKTLTLPVFGASKGLDCYKKILDYYNNKSFIKPNGEYDLTPIENSALKILTSEYGLVLNGKKQTLPEDIVIYPKEYFCSTKWDTGKITRYPELYVIHYAEGSWLSDDMKKQNKRRIICKRFFGEKLGDIIGIAIGYVKTQGWNSLFVHGRNFIIRQIGSSLMKIVSNLHINKKKIVFSNFLGRGYGDNPKYIAEELLSRSESLDLVWIVNELNCKMPKRIRKVKKGSFREVLELATAGIWVDNVRKEEFVFKNKKQKYIQTWHGFYPLKKMEKDAIKLLSEEYVRSAIHDASITDLMVSGCKERTKIYQNSFWYNGEINECGTPRNDIFFKDINFKQIISRYFNIPENTKILIYAPTFRDNRSVEPYNINLDQLLDVLKNRFGGNWCILIRLHPLIREKSNFMKYSQNVIDASSYDDIQELFAGSDILISDYSDCMFEFSLQRKPVFLYASDLEAYTNGRSFYYDIRELPYPIAESDVELRSIIMNYNQDEYLKRLNNFFNKIGVLEKGTASKCVADYIIKNVKNK